MPTVAGIDTSTQSCKLIVCDAESGKVLREARAPHPDGTEVDPHRWWSALVEAGLDDLDGVDAVAVAGQQHGMVVLDEAGEVVRPALLWNDTRSADAARDLVSELGGAQAWADAVGSVPLASFTVSKLRWLAVAEPDLAERVAAVLLPHDWLTWRLTGCADAGTTDRGDASGTGYWSPREGRYRPDLLQLAFGREINVPRVAAPDGLIGETRSGVPVAAGTGDNMGAALGLGAGPGDIVVSIGTSGTVFAIADKPTADATGHVAGFADGTGRFLPLVCTLNAARVLTAAASMLGTDLAGLDRLALEASPGSGGVVCLPYLDGERTPNLPDATGSLHGLTRASMSPHNFARAAIEGVLCGLADGLEALRALGVPAKRAILIGGGARSEAVLTIAQGILGLPVAVPTPGEYVALGAARQAAWAISGELPPWGVEVATPDPAGGGASSVGDAVRAAYAHYRDVMYG